MMWHDWIPVVNALLMTFVIHRQMLIGQRLGRMLELCSELIAAQKKMTESEIKSHEGILQVLRGIKDKMRG